MDNHKPIQLSDGKYAAPTSGLYSVKSQAVIYSPTGEYKTVPNPDKKWWQFWKEDYIVEKIYRTEILWTGSGIQFLAEGEVVDFPILYKL